MPHRLTNIPRRWLALALGLSLLLGAFEPATRAQEEESPNVPPGEMQAKVKVVEAASGELPITLKAEGTFVFSRQSPASIAARTSSVVRSVEVREGQEVTSGQVVARLDDRPARSALAKAQSQLLAASAELKQARGGGLDLAQAELDRAASQTLLAADQARREATRQAVLLGERLASEKAESLARQTLAEAEQNARTAADKARLFRASGREAELSRLLSAAEAAQAELSAVRLEVEYSTLVAPQPGRIARLKLQPGEKVEPGDVVAQVVGAENTVLRLYVAPVDADTVQPGCAVAATPMGATEPWSGKVATIADELDPDTGLVPVEVRLEAHRSRSPRVGEVVLAEITTARSAPGIVVPVSALSSDDNGYHVYTVDAEHLAHLIPVQVLARNAAQAVVGGEGLSGGARVIVDGNYNLPDGARVIEVQEE